MTAKRTIPRHCVTVYLSDEDHEKLRQLGQSVWLQRMIAEAKPEISYGKSRGLISLGLALRPELSALEQAWK